MRPDEVCTGRVNVVNGRCYCDGCVLRRRRISSRSSLRRAAGTQDGYEPAAKTAERIRAMLNLGLSCTYIARETGYGSRERVRKLSKLAPSRDAIEAANGQRVLRSRAEAVERLHLRIMDDRRCGRPVAEGEVGAMRKGTVPIRVTRLAIEGLQAQGYSLEWIGQQLGVGRQQIYGLRTKHKLTSAEMEEKFVALARRVGSAESTASQARRTKNIALRKGYLPTIHFDEFI